MSTFADSAIRESCPRGRVETQSAEAYAFLASAVAGRSIAVRRASRDVDRAFSDGRSIVLPSLASGDLEAERLQVAIQAALIAAGSLDVAVVYRLIGRRQLTIARYLYLEVFRACRLIEDRLPPFVTRQLLSIQTQTATASALASLQRAAGREHVPDPPSYFGSIRPLALVRSVVGDSGEAAGEYRPPAMPANRSSVAPLNQVIAGLSVFLRMLQNPFSRGNVLSDLLQMILGAGPSAAGEKSTNGEGGGSDRPVGRIARVLGGGVHALMARWPKHLPELEFESIGRTRLYPEWDSVRRAYHMNRVIVEEVGIENVGTERRPDSFSHDLIQGFAAFKLQHRMLRYQRDGTDLDTSRMIDAVIDIRCGHSPESMDIYRTIRPVRGDLAVTIIIDISASTGEKDLHEVRPFDKQLQLAYRLGFSLDALGDRVSIFGFHSWGPSRVKAVRLKDHRERWSRQMGERFASLEPSGYTRIGAAVRHGTRALREEVRSSRRLLVLLTDGIAYDEEYERDHAKADTCKALEEGATAGVACVCVSVGASTRPEELVDVFGSSNTLVVDEVVQAINHLPRMCRAALSSAAARRVHM